MLKPFLLLFGLCAQFLRCALIALSQAIMFRIGSRALRSLAGGGILGFVGSHLCAACGGKPSMDKTARCFPIVVFMIVMNPKGLKVMPSYRSQHYEYIGETLVLR